MNKAKFMLVGIGVVGVVGSALAFKAQKFSGAKYCTDFSTPTCPANAHYNTATPGGDATQLHCTAAANTSCTATLTVVLID